MNYRNGRIDMEGLFPEVYPDRNAVIENTHERAQQFEEPWDVKKVGQNHQFGRKMSLLEAMENLKERLKANEENGDRDSFYLRSESSAAIFVIREAEALADFHIVPREEWGAEEPRSRTPLALPTPEVFIHHTVSSSPTDLPGQKALMRKLQADAKAENYADIEYNFVIFQDGSVFEGRGFGTTSGATVNDFFNSRSHSFCAAGNFDGSPGQANMQPSDALLAAFQALNRRSRERGFVARNAPIRAHRDVKATACPGSNLFARLRSIE